MRRAVVFVLQDDVRPDVWSELEELLVRIGHRFGRVDLRRWGYVHGLRSGVPEETSFTCSPRSSGPSTRCWTS